jgi:hypothetical protein
LSFELYPIGEVFGGGFVNVKACEYMYDDEAQSVDAGGSWPYPSAAAQNDARVIAHPAAVVENGACQLIVDSEEIAEPELAGILQACETTVEPESCDAQTICVPRTRTPFSDGVCIWAEGEVECPAGTDFVQRDVRYSGTVDTRACSDCSCGMASGEACADATLILSRTAAASVNVPADGTCDLVGLDGSPGWTAITYDPGEPSGGSCRPGGGQSEGEVAPETQITFCCS